MGEFQGAGEITGGNGRLNDGEQCGLSDAPPEVAATHLT